MYKSKTCIACFAKEESLEHLAECCIYQKIWEKIEGIILEELDLRLNKKWNLTNTSQRLKAILLGTNTKDKLDKRKLLIRGLTSISLIAEVKEVMESGSKASKVICWFIEIFWSNFFEKLWKFHCEMMIEREKRNGITCSLKKKRLKQKRKISSDHNYANKENQDLQEIINKEKKKDKVFRLQKSAESKVSNWIKTGTKDSWFSFKNN